MREEEYLKYIIKGLQGKIAKMEEKIGDVSKDIENMNDYFWENFSEFDEYGYEEYDNHTAYMMRSRERDDSFEELKRYTKMVYSPYFGKIEFVYEGENEPESFYIGIGNFWEEDEMVPLVFDWRAPVSSLFYDYDKGPASYEAPAGTLNGEIVKKMQFKIKRGEMVYAIECDVKIDDEILRNELANHGDVRLKSIVTSIQKEQNAIIRNMQDKIMVIQGCAGSGKTSIALHRIAYLLYHNRNTLKASNVLILSPNGIFADYISHILPELGEENISEMSFDDFAYHELKDIADTEDFYDYLENILTLYKQSEEEVNLYVKGVKKKLSKECAIDINEFVLRLEYELMDFRDFKYKGIQKEADYFAEMFYEKFPDVPIMKRMESIAEYIIDEEETLKDRDYEPEEKQEVVDKLNRMYETTSLLKLYNRFLEEFDYDTMEEKTEKISYGDVYPMLYLKYHLLGTKNLKPVKHLVIDEMQDYSYMHYLLIDKLFHCPMTILGDKAQTIGDVDNDVRKVIREILGKEVKEIELNKSYRSTKEIMEFACSITNETATIPFERHGKVPEILEFSNPEEKMNALIGAIKGNETAETMAVLCADGVTADELYKTMKEELTEFDKHITLIDKNSVKFKPGLIITTYYMAKGLEFDSVYVADGENSIYDTPLGKQALYVCATRALHTFDIYR